MQPERTFAGWQLEFRPAGAGRYGGAAFLSVWLVFWTAGEAFAVLLLGRGAWSLLTGAGFTPGQAPLAPSAALPIGLFLFVWLTLWTFGGVMAAREVLRLLFGRDLVILGPDQIRVELGYGLFTTRRELARSGLRRIYVAGAAGPLRAETQQGCIDLARLGTPAERQAAAEFLHREAALPTAPLLGGALPARWLQESSPEGAPIVRRNPAGRRRISFALGAGAAALATGSGLLTLSRPGFLGFGGAAVAAVGTIALGAVAWVLRSSPKEWAWGDGTLRLQRRRAGRLQVRFVARGLLLWEESDSDGDPWFRLIAQSTPGDVPGAPKDSQTIDSTAADPTELRNFGLWLSAQTGLPFRDGTSPGAKDLKLRQLLATLAASGSFGRWLSRWLAGRMPPER